MARITYDHIAGVMGDEAAERVHALAQEAEQVGVRFALVGGVVRDVLLHLAPDHYDFATARSEVYERPGALPIPAPATLEDDLRRRDFTVNAMALMLAPREEYGQVIDRHAGLNDLDSGELRVLHPQSFLDDPTRIYRGARLAARLGFAFADDTGRLIKRALAAVDAVSGERLRTELRLILIESSAPDALNLLDENGALAAVHPALRVTDTLDDDLLAVHDDPPADLETAAWCAWLCRLEPDEIKEIAVRLAFSAALAGAVGAAAALVRDPGELSKKKPSAVYRRLHGLPEPAIAAAGRVLGKQAAKNIEKYLTAWRYYKTAATGETLKRLGVPPGPRYKLILQQLLDARLDGIINSDDAESTYLRELIDRLPADGSA